MIAPIWRECYISMGIVLPMTSLGAMFAYPASLVPGITSNNTDFTTTKENAHWVAASLGISGAVSFLIVSPMMQLYGRKASAIFMHTCSLVGCVMMALAYDFTTLFIGRLLHGMAAPGIILSTVLIAEYSHPKRRGVFVAIKILFIHLGVLLMHICSFYLTWRQLAWAMAVPLISAILLVFTWPESPSWLAYKHRFTKCIEAFEWIRGKNEESEREVTELIAAQRKIQEVVRKEKFYLRLYTAFTTKYFLKPLTVIVSMAIAAQFSGLVYLVAFIIDIMTELSGGDKSTAFYYIIVFDIMKVFGAFVFLAIERLVNRRTVLLGGGGISTVILLASCLLQYLQDLNLVVPWVAAWTLILYSVMVNLTMIPVILVMKGEVIPLEYRGLGLTILGVTDSLLVFVTTKLTPVLLESLKSYGLFCVYIIVVVLMLVILYFILPETKDRTLQNVESKFINFDNIDKMDRQVSLLSECNDTMKCKDFGKINLNMTK